MDPRVQSSIKPITLLPAKLSIVAPGGGGGAINIQNLDYIQLNRMMGIKPYDIGNALSLADEEFQYIEEFEQKYKEKSAMAFLEKERIERTQRLIGKQEKVHAEEAVRMRRETERIDEEFVKKMVEEEQKRAQKQKEEEARKQDMVVKLGQACNIDYEVASKHLAEGAWNYEAVLYKLKEPERRQEMILKLLSANQYLEYDQAQSLLAQSDWNLERALAKNQQQNRFTINLVILGGMPAPNNNPREFLTQDFNQNQEAMTMIEFLNTRKPIPQDLFYYIYRQETCQANQKISYTELTKTFRDLNIYSGNTFYVKKESTFPY